MRKHRRPRLALGVRLGAGAVVVAVFAGSGAAETSAGTSPEGIPYWAFAVNPAPSTPSMPSAPSANATPSGERARRVPASDRAFTTAQVKDLNGVPDWHPDGHPPMPGIVARGRKPAVYACGYCHLPNGQGRPENSSLAGLPASYIIAQVAEFRNARRKRSEPRHVPTELMGAEARNVRTTDLAEAARYSAGLWPRPWIRVVETDVVAMTRVAGWMLVASGESGTEPIGERIIELPVDLERTELRDDGSGFVAYVPVGSVGKGEALVKTGGRGRTIACGRCHGPALRGLGAAPPLAGRSPSYVVRQLYDIQHGARTGPATQLMQGPVARLTLMDMVSIAAYTASLEP